MKESGRIALREEKFIEEASLASLWRREDWNKLKSFTEVGIDPKAKILSLWPGFGNLAKEYTKFEEKIGLSYEKHQTLWAAVTLLQQIGGDDATIEEFQNIKVKDMAGILSLTPLHKRILERLFSKPIKVNI